MNKQSKRLTYKDTPAIRKRRLQERLQEISEKSEQELKSLMKSLEKLKTSFNPQNKKSLSKEGSIGSEQD